MGGREGVWGYLAQSVVCVIESLIENDWEFVHIEPDTDNEKVDIIWYYENRQPKVVQVKTSKRNFQLSNIREWLEALINDVKDASCYELILLGTCNENTKDSINRINEKRALDKDLDNVILKSNSNKLKISLLVNDLNALESLIYRYLNKYLSGKDISLGDNILEVISNTLSYAFVSLATQGEMESRESFEKKLLKWIHDLSLGESKNKLDRGLINTNNIIARDNSNVTIIGKQINNYG